MTQVLTALDSAGYHVYQHLFRTELYGIPQRRRRVILIGCRDNFSITGDISVPETGECPLTINEIFADLQHIQAGEGEIRGDGRKASSKRNAWMVENWISDDLFPVTYHQARPTNDHDKEIYRRAVEMWNSGKQRFNYAIAQPKDK